MVEVRLSNTELRKKVIPPICSKSGHPWGISSPETAILFRNRCIQGTVACHKSLYADKHFQENESKKLVLRVGE